jgi:hypothetical protein
MPEATKSANVKDQSAYTAKSQLTGDYTDIDRWREEIYRPLNVLPVPYAFILGGVNVWGILYLNLVDPTKSWTEGRFIGIVVGNYLLSKDHTDVCAEDPLGRILKACLKLDLQAKKLEGRLCNWKTTGSKGSPPSFTAEWECGPWVPIITW